MFWTLISASIWFLFIFYFSLIKQRSAAAPDCFSDAEIIHHDLLAVRLGCGMQPTAGSFINYRAQNKKKTKTLKHSQLHFEPNINSLVWLPCLDFLADWGEGKGISQHGFVAVCEFSHLGGFGSNFCPQTPQETTAHCRTCDYLLSKRPSCTGLLVALSQGQRKKTRDVLRKTLLSLFFFF